MPMEPLVLDTPRRVADFLLVPYRFSNAAEDAVFLRCLVADTYGVSEDLRLDAQAELALKAPRPLVGVRPAPTPELAWVSWDGASGVVLTQGDADLPLGAAGATRAVRVRAGGRFRAAIRLRLPLTEWHAQLPPSTRPAERVMVNRVELRVERCRTGEPGASCGLREVWATTGRAADVVRAVATLAEPVALLRRTDAVERIR